MELLRINFSVEVNTTRNISEAERLYDLLHYNNERSVAFELFINKVHKMYTILG